MNFKKATLLIVFLSISISFAQQNFIPFQADYATFKGNDGKSYLEVYLSLFQTELTYDLEDSVKTAHFEHEIQIFDSDSMIAQTLRKYKNTMELGKNQSIINQFVDVFAFELEPGDYKLTAKLFEDVTNRSGEYNIDIEIPDYSTDFSMSMIEMASKAEKATTPSNFSSKNNICIYPNPTKVFGLIYPVLYYYFEAYNLKSDPDGNTNYTYHYYITDMNGNMIRDFPRKDRKRPSSTIAEANGTNVIALPSDIYVLNIDLIDNVSGDSLGAKTKFMVKKLDKKKTSDQLATKTPDEPFNQYQTFTEEQLKDEFAKASYIASSEEEDIFEELDADGMRRFLMEFWKRRDTDPTTSYNEYKQQYLENAELANAQYSSSYREGWKTDRGRIILIYGKPDEIERNPSTINTQPYEIWYFYSLDGGSEFMFGDVSGHGQYELLNSTYRNELQDPNWMDRLDVRGAGF